MSLITIKKGDLFASDCDALVNPVNCLGVHGAGLARDFKMRWPQEVAQFTSLAKRGRIKIGFVFPVGVDPSILFFPTKDHWRDPSRIEWIRDGLEALVEIVHELQPESVAIPALGCGYGGLQWSEVRPLIEQAARRMLVRVDIFEPMEGA